MAPPKSRSRKSSRKESKISVASLTGALFSISLIIGAVLHGSDNIRAFFSLEGVLIVIGGTLAVAFMSYQASDVKEALKGLGLMFKKASTTHENMNRDLVNIIGWARVMREKGLRGLENVVDEGINDPFVRYGLEMVVSNYSPEEVRDMMETAADAYYERDTVPAHVLMAMASHAPAFGMVGTLIGMVVMLGNFSGDMSGVGTGLSIALLATLYGVVSARMLYMPAASKIMQKQEDLRFRNHLITEGMVMLVANKSPHFIQDRLSSFLKPGLYKRSDLNAAAAAAPQGPVTPPLTSGATGPKQK